MFDQRRLLIRNAPTTPSITTPNSDRPIRLARVSVFLVTYSPGRKLPPALADPAVWKDGPRTRELTSSRDEARRALDERYAAWEDAVKRLEEEVPA